MSDARSLYDDVVMDHIRNARHYGAMADPDQRATGLNRLCGDELTVFLRVEGDRIPLVQFECSCCGISMASASIMTEAISGHSLHEARELVGEIVAALHGAALPERTARTGQLALLVAALAEFPSRVNCAVLPWRTLDAAIDGRTEAAV